MISAIACVYPDGSLTGPWFQFSQRLKVAVRRAGLQGTVELIPVSAAGPGYDLIVAEAPVSEGTRAVLSGNGMTVIEIDPAAHESLPELVSRLAIQAGWERQHRVGRQVALHRGFQQVGWQIRERQRSE